MAIQLTPDQVSDIESVTENGTRDFYLGYREINNFIFDNQADLGQGDVDAKTEFWYQQAALINDPESTDPSKSFIYNVTKYGFALDGRNDVDLQAISNGIASKVISDTTANAQIEDIDTLVKDDIGVVLDGFGATIGGWGGSFYYWNQMRSDGNTVGYDVEHTANDGYDKGEKAKFEATNGAAIAASASTASGLGAAIKIAVGYPFGDTAELPYSEAIAVSGRAVDLILHGGSIVGDPNQIGAFTYSNGQWTSITSGFGFDTMPSVVTASSDVAADLDAHREWIMDHSDVTYGTGDQKHADVIVDPSTNTFVEAGTATGIPVANTFAGMYAYSDAYLELFGFDGSNYQDTYNDDGVKIASAKVYTTGGRVGASISDSSFLRISEQDLFSSTDDLTVEVKQLAVGATGSSDVTPILNEFDEVSTDPNSDWKYLTSSYSPDPSDDSFVLSVEKQDGSSYELSQSTPSDLDENSYSHVVWQENFYDASGALTSRFTHYDAEVNLTAGPNDVSQSVNQLGTDELQTFSDGGAYVYTQVWDGGDVGAQHLVLPSGFDGTWTNAQQIFNKYLPPTAGTTVA